MKSAHEVGQWLWGVKGTRAKVHGSPNEATQNPVSFNKNTQKAKQTPPKKKQKNKKNKKHLRISAALAGDGLGHHFLFQNHQEKTNKQTHTEQTNKHHKHKKTKHIDNKQTIDNAKINTKHKYTLNHA